MSSVYLPLYNDGCYIFKIRHSCAILCPFEIPTLKDMKLRNQFPKLGVLRYSWPIYFQKTSKLPHYDLDFDLKCSEYISNIKDHNSAKISTGKKIIPTAFFGCNSNSLTMQEHLIWLEHVKIFKFCAHYLLHALSCLACYVDKLMHFKLCFYYMEMLIKTGTFTPLCHNSQLWLGSTTHKQQDIGVPCFSENK